MRFSARVLFFIVFLFSLFTIFFGKTFAQNSTSTEIGDYSAEKYSNQLDSNVPNDQRTYVQSTVIELLAAFTCQLGGYDPVRPDHRCLGVDSQTGKIGFVENGGGAIRVVSSLIASTFTPPISSADYFRYMAGNFGLSQKVYAQTPNPCATRNPSEGYGFCGIRPLLPMWVAMRNIAYLLFVIIFVLIGLAIMFRVHVDPRTVMTIENQIPKIILGIILVTFSFAIAGLLIDVMYVSLYLVGGTILSAFPNSGIKLVDIATSPTPFDAINRLFTSSTVGRPSELGGVSGGFNALSAQGGAAVRELVIRSTDGSVATTINIWDIFTNTLSFIAGVIVNIIAIFVIFLALLYTCIRLFIILISAYINILLDIIFAPFWFLIGLFPGSSLGVGAWFKDMLANLAVYPTAVAMFIFGAIFTQIAGPLQLGGSSVTSGMFIPPLTGGATGAGSDVFGQLVALGFIFMTPHVLTITRGAIKAPNINYGPVFETPGSAFKAITGSLKEAGAMRVASEEYVPGAGGSWDKRGLTGAFRTRTFR